MTRLSWFWVALVTAYVVALFQFSDVVFAFVPEGHYNSATRVVLGLTLGVVMWKFLPRAWGAGRHSAVEGSLAGGRGNWFAVFGAGLWWQRVR
jgi:hypothetical protein